jgi:hypothetical protein
MPTVKNVKAILRESQFNQKYKTTKKMIFIEEINFVYYFSYFIESDFWGG